MTKRRDVSSETIKRDISEIRRSTADGRTARLPGLLKKYELVEDEAHPLTSRPDVPIRGGTNLPTEAMALNVHRQVAEYAKNRAAHLIGMAKTCLLEADRSLDAVLKRSSSQERRDAERAPGYPGHRPITEADLKVALAEQVKRTQAGSGVMDEEAFDRWRRSQRGRRDGPDAA